MSFLKSILTYIFYLADFEVTESQPREGTKSSNGFYQKFAWVAEVPLLV